MKRKYSILTKVGFFYIVFTLVSFLVSGIILRHEATWHMDNILNKRLDHRENWIKKLIENKPEKLRNRDYAYIEKVEKIPDNFHTIHRDTVIVNEENQIEEIHRKRISYTTINNQAYRIEIHKSAEELYRFRDDIFEVILPVFIIMSLGIILINYLSSGYLLAPFKFILRQMAGYNITQKGSTKVRKTTTREFDELQQLFLAMQNRISRDYHQLKNYTENMSHELQTPLSIIQNKAEQLLSAENLDNQQAEKLKVIYTQTKQLSRLGSVLNLITKIENQEFTNINPVPTAPAIHQYLDNITEFAQNRHLAFQTTLNPQHRFLIDSDLLNIMLRNLINNALYYAPTGSTIQIITDSKNLTIKNQGAPIDFDTAQIFNRFKKGSNSKSLGLGLSIVKQICEISQLKITYAYNKYHIFVITPK